MFNNHSSFLHLLLAEEHKIHKKLLVVTIVLTELLPLLLLVILKLESQSNHLSIRTVLLARPINAATTTTTATTISRRTEIHRDVVQTILRCIITVWRILLRVSVDETTTTMTTVFLSAKTDLKEMTTVELETEMTAMSTEEEEVTALVAMAVPRIATTTCTMRPAAWSLHQATAPTIRTPILLATTSRRLPSCTTCAPTCFTNGRSSPPSPSSWRTRR